MLIGKECGSALAYCSQETRQEQTIFCIMEKINQLQVFISEVFFSNKLDQ